MSRYCDAMKRKIFHCILIVFQAVFCVVVCQGDSFWCGDRQEQPLKAVRGQNISRRFRLDEALTETQTLVWAKNVTLDDRLSDFIDNTSANQGRYKLTKVPGENLIDLFIAFTKQSDSGKHVIKIHQGAQALCSVVVFKLTIESTEPICSTLLHQESGKLQMSCQWFQLSVGHQAQLLAGDQVVYEYEIKGISSEHDLNATNNMNKVSVYLSSDEQIVPSNCLIFDKQRHYNMTCEFHLIQNHAVRDGQPAPQHFRFECCSTQETGALSWWYSNGSILYSLNLSAEISVNKERESFFCGIQHRNLTVRVYKIENVLFAAGKEYNLFLSSESEGTTEAIGNSSCEKILLNATLIKKDKYHPKDDEINMASTQSNTVETNVSSDTPGTYDKTRNTVTTWPWVLLVLSVIFCLTTGFANCFYFALRKYRYHFGKDMNDGIQRNSAGSAGDDGAQSRNLANSQTQPLQMCMEYNLLGDFTRGGALDQGEQRRERKTQFPKNQDEPPSLHSQHQFGEYESSFSAHHPPNHDSIVEDHGGAIRRTTTCSKASTNEHKGSELASAQNDNTAYCSVDDVKDTPTDIAKESKSSQATSVLHPKPSSKGYEAHQDHVSENALTSFPLTSETSKLKKKVRGASTGLDALYAKPDMSRKTKKVTCLEPDCVYPKAPGPTPDLDPPLHLGHSSNSIFLGHADFYGNMITNPTDEVTDDGALYINASGHTLK